MTTSFKKYEWPAVFLQERRKLVLAPSYAERENALKDRDILNVLAENFSELDRVSYHTDKLQEFYGGVSWTDLENLQLDEKKGSASKIVVFNRDHEGRIREQHGPVTPAALFLILRPPRSDSDSAMPQHLQSTSDEVRESTQECSVELPPERGQLTIYISNLDRESFSAVAATAAQEQAIQVSRLLSGYVAFEPALQVHITPKGPKCYALEFHLPFLAIRDAESLPRDTRMDKGGKSLRTAFSLSFLDQISAAGSDHTAPYRPKALYEAQYSILVSGYDKHSWTTYCFVDTYFDNTSRREDAQPDEHADANGDEYPSDPVTLDPSSIAEPQSCPRQYFLGVVESRLDRVTEEWRQVVDFLMTKIQDCTARYQRDLEETPLDIDKVMLSIKDVEDRRQKLEELNKLNLSVGQLLNQATHLLESTVKASKAFDSTQSSFFYQEGVESNIGRDALHSLVRVETLFQRLEFYQQELVYQKSVFTQSYLAIYERFNRDLDLFLVIAQQKTSNDVRMLAWMNTCGYPVALAAAVCSISTHPRNLVHAILVASAIVALFIVASKYRRWCQEKLHCIRLLESIRTDSARLSIRGEP